MAEGRCGPDGYHEAPDPVDEPTKCPCGVLTRMPPPTSDPQEDDHGRH